MNSLSIAPHIHELRREQEPGKEMKGKKGKKEDIDTILIHSLEKREQIDMKA